MSLFPAAGLPGDLPGEDLVRAGLDDLKAGRETVEALLVSVGASRLRRLGIRVEAALSDPEDRLFRLLEQQYGSDAHSRYNALTRRLVSFERAAESLV